MPRFAAAVLFVFSLTADVVLAQDVVLQVMLVKAKQHGESDPELVRLRPRLKHLVGYRSYRMVEQRQRGCRWQTTEQFLLPGGRILLLRPQRMTDQLVIMQVQVLQGEARLVDTDVQLRNQGTMFLGLGRNGRVEDDGALLIMVKAGVPQ